MDNVILIVGLVATIVSIVGGISTVLWRLKNDRRWVEDEKDKLTRWRVRVDAELERLVQWRMATDGILRDLRSDVHKLIRRLDRSGVNGDKT